MPSLNDAEKTDVRRFCGYPFYGSGAAGFQSWRFYQVSGTLEYRMSNLAASEMLIVRRQLATLNALELAMSEASGHLDTNQAATWQRNPNEPRDRQKLFDDMRRRLCGLFGLPAGPGLADTSVRLVI